VDEESGLSLCRNYQENKMQAKRNESLNELARELRKNMTREEKHLWYDFLKKLPLTVKRQTIIGSYIIDFYIDSKQIAIEVDGRQHRLPEQIEADARRDSELNFLGIKVIRYSNKDINENFKTVCEDVLKHLALKAEDLKTVETKGG
jgi:very-short-patch-repair endonuclease